MEGNTLTPMGSPDYKKQMEILDKKWVDCTVEEKLEKVREELIHLGHNTNRVNNIDMEIAKLRNHSHQDGKVVIPMTDNNNGLGYAGVSRRNNLN